MSKKVKTYSIHLLLALIAISIPMMVSFTKDDHKPNLIGMVINDQKPEMNKTNWFSGLYASEMDDYNNDCWAYKELMVKLNNQFYYDAFNIMRLDNFVTGKENYVFGESTIHSYYGADYMGKEKISEFLRKCKVIQDTLERKGISLVLAFAPGKGIGAPEFFEDKYKRPRGKTNIDDFLEVSQQMKLNHIDLVSYFHQIKDTCRYPLYTRFAHHWTYYFECLAVKKIINYMEQLRQVDLPEIGWNTLQISDTARHRDHDVLKSMNLYTKPPQNMPLAYPDLLLESDSTNAKVKMLTIADSYWYGIVYMDVPKYCFDNGQFWYYNNRVVPNPSQTEKVEAWQLDLKESIEQCKIVLILGSDPALPALGWGFVDNAYELYTNPKAYYERIERTKLIKQYEKQIRELPNLLKKSTQNSMDRMITLDSAIKYDAMKMAGLIK
ncbi:MAG: hypothetical protein IPM51_09790 [Sphingobacteriaceae bacterium]|nr:hypothetical protein [Sphingobacteriaceae bacterium]